MFTLRNSSIKDVKFGKKVTVVDPVNLYGCKLGDNVFIGPFVEIQKNVIINKNSRIQSHSFICEKVNIGKNCFIGHGVIFINDKFQNGKPSGRNKIKSTIIGNNVSIGSNSSVLPVSICGNVVIGAGSVVSKNINKPGVYAGNPARFVRKL
jgi:acetyltransferase-like isoleucine patch superfamily enzyme